MAEKVPTNGEVLRLWKALKDYPREGLRLIIAEAGKENAGMGEPALGSSLMSLTLKERRLQNKPSQKAELEAWLSEPYSYPTPGLQEQQPYIKQEQLEEAECECAGLRQANQALVREASQLETQLADARIAVEVANQAKKAAEVELSALKGRIRKELVPYLRGREKQHKERINQLYTLIDDLKGQLAVPLPNPSETLSSPSAAKRPRLTVPAVPPPAPLAAPTSHPAVPPPSTTGQEAAAAAAETMPQLDPVTRCSNCTFMNHSRRYRLQELKDKNLKIAELENKVLDLTEELETLKPSEVGAEKYGKIYSLAQEMVHQLVASNIPVKRMEVVCNKYIGILTGKELYPS